MSAPAKRVAMVVLALACAGEPAALARLRTRGDVVVRAKPSVNARVIDRVRAAVPLKIVGKAHRGQWTHVRTAHRDGWLPSEELVDDRPKPARAENQPLAPARPVEPPAPAPRPARAETWVAASKYHDQAPERAQVAVERAVLYVRPSVGAPMVTSAKRSEVVDVVRRSTDGKWCLVHAEGGVLAWVDGAALAPAPRPAVEPPMAPSFTVAARAEPAASAAAAPVESVVEAPEPPPRPHRLTVTARAGLAILGQRLSSNGARPLGRFEFSTFAAGAAIAVGYERALGRHLRLDADAGYAFAGGGTVHAPGSDGRTHVLAIQSHTVGAGVAVGVHGRALGGVEARLRVGGLVELDPIDADPLAPVVSQQIYALSIGVAIALPNLFTIAHRPLGLQAFGAALAPATRVQAAGLEDGRSQTTYGFAAGGGLSWLVASSERRGQLTLVADFQYAAAISRFEGAPASCAFGAACATVANRGSLTQLVTLGLTYSR